MARTEAEDLDYLEYIKECVGELLVKEKIQARTVGRIKSVYSIYRKMVKRNIPLEKVYDKLAVRVIVQSVPECYQVLGIIHTHFTPIQGTFDDYIASPKSNNYQSLHTAIYPIKGIVYKPVEIQIRTEQMNQDSEFGAAAHWRYKDQEFLETDSEEQKRWIRSLIMLRDKFEHHAQFVQALKSDVFEENLIVFDHLGKVIYLPVKATAKDFAEYLNLPIQRDRVFAKVNDRICSLSRSLKSGDTVEICIWKDEMQDCFPLDQIDDRASNNKHISLQNSEITPFAHKGGSHNEKK
ncbi:bifunctional (p)ppGpp synthetase/guanosine-3',5'-bis(diphosphate) 3'-pyrophosphohydrolase [bacterium]|nr:bifunctional (p)ppGpp synthetase/guanosine-3',5'-bis(diphosphate) 3'-pyrophosphohydrolase [bacterium]